MVNQNLLDCDPAKSVEDTGEKGDEENHLSKYLYVAEVDILLIFSKFPTKKFLKLNKKRELMLINILSYFTCINKQKLFMVAPSQ